MTQSQLHKRIVSYFNKSKLNHEDIALVLRIPRTAISSILNNTRELTAYEALKLCQLFKVEPNDFLNWKGDEP